MTIQALKRKQKELLASQVSNLVSETNENLLRVNLTKFFTDLEHEIQSSLLEYWNDTILLQGQVNLILSPIHEKHQEYYKLLMEHKLQEFKRAEKEGERLVKREMNRIANKAAKPVKFDYNKNNLFGTLKYSEDKLSEHTFTASQRTLDRVDKNINDILTEGYRSGHGIDEVSRRITERFDQLRTWEAKRIARTEIHTAQNMGVMNSYGSLGVEYTQWVAARDSRVRVSHMDIDGEIVAFGDPYSNGLEYPGDTRGPINEWINCRCSNAPFVMPADMMAPSFSPFRESDLIPIDLGTTITEPQTIEELDLETVNESESFKDKLKEQLEEIIDEEQEEKDLIFDTLSEFMDEVGDELDHEIATYIDNNNKISKAVGNDSSVNVPYHVVEEGNKNGLLFSIHNHPNNNSMQSIGDIKTAVNLREKYAFTYVPETKEFLLLKNKNVQGVPKYYYEAVYGEDIVSKFTDYRKKVLKDYHKNSKELKETIKLYKKGKLSKEEATIRQEKIYAKYRMDTLDKDINNLNNLLEKEGVEFIRIKVE